MVGHILMLNKRCLVFDEPSQVCKFKPSSILSLVYASKQLLNKISKLLGTNTNLIYCLMNVYGPRFTTDLMLQYSSVSNTFKWWS